MRSKHFIYTNFTILSFIKEPINLIRRIKTPTIRMSECQFCELLKDAKTYQPDTLDLNRDRQAAEYWFPRFREMIVKNAKQAASSQSATDAKATERAEKFQLSYISRLNELENQSKINGHNNVRLSTRELLEMNDAQLRCFGFPDPWLQQKRKENAKAVDLLKQRLKELDDVQNEDKRWTELVRGVLAGNMFDWGAQDVANILEANEDFNLDDALGRIQAQPWLMDNLDEWLKCLHEKTHKFAAIFVDNSGVDIILGILPFARELLKRGTNVLLCANTEPSLNDVTSSELTDLLNICSRLCPILSEAWSTKKLQVYGNGQHGPCLDMRTLPLELCEAIHLNSIDLLIIEGMGRALHTNLNAKFKCDTLKLAVVKNKWLAQYLGGNIFDVMCKFEHS